MEKTYLKLNDIECYKVAFHLSNYVWDVVISWDYFAKDTVGKQFVRAADSISANIAEGFGRYFRKEKMQFYRYAKGSVKECLDWNQKSKVRDLITDNSIRKYTNPFTNSPGFSIFSLSTQEKN
jgi:four helix bundle protein